MRKFCELTITHKEIDKNLRPIFFGCVNTTLSRHTQTYGSSDTLTVVLRNAHLIETLIPYFEFQKKEFVYEMVELRTEFY